MSRILFLLLSLRIRSVLSTLTLWAPIAVSAASDYPVLESTQIDWIGDRIFANECNRQAGCLTAWNLGEDFPSMGIGHFIWYREGQSGIYQESFPGLLDYLVQNGISLPAWIIEAEFNAPWESRAQFLEAMDGDELIAFRNLLHETIDLQTAFIVERFQQARNLLQTRASQDQSTLLDRHFLAVANAAPPYGLYALIDYVNFKGEGVAVSERYQQQGWGLMQVLEQMPDQTDAPLQDFVTAARQVLSRRVDNAPAERNEQRWLSGWNARLDTYLPAGATP